jgi:ribosomal protein L37E
MTADDQTEIDFWTAALEEHSNRAMLNISRQALAKLLGIIGKLRTEQRPPLALTCNHCGHVPSIEVRLGELCATCGIGGFTMPRRMN